MHKECLFLLGWLINHPWVVSELAERLGMALTRRLRTPPQTPLIGTGEGLPLSFSSPSLHSKFKVSDFLYYGIKEAEERRRHS